MCRLLSNHSLRVLGFQRVEDDAWKVLLFKTTLCLCWRLNYQLAQVAPYVAASDSARPAVVESIIKYSFGLYFLNGLLRS